MKQQNMSTNVLLHTHHPHSFSLFSEHETAVLNFKLFICCCWQWWWRGVLHTICLIPPSNYWFSTPTLVTATFWFHLPLTTTPGAVPIPTVIFIRHKKKCNSNNNSMDFKGWQEEASQDHHKEENKSRWSPCREAKLVHAIQDTQPSWYHGGCNSNLWWRVENCPRLSYCTLFWKRCIILEAEVQFSSQTADPNWRTQCAWQGFSRQKESSSRQKESRKSWWWWRRIHLKEGYQQQGPPLCQPSQSEEAAPSQEVPGSGTTSAWSKVSWHWTSPWLAGRGLEPQLWEKQKDDEEEQEEEDDDDDDEPVISVAEAISTTLSTTLTTPGLKSACTTGAKCRSSRSRSSKQHQSTFSKQYTHVIASVARGKQVGADQLAPGCFRTVTDWSIVEAWTAAAQSE